MTLKAGKYWIGDPCYVLKEENGFNWIDVLNESSYFHNRKDGDYTVTKSDGGKFQMACYGTAHGDGSFFDENENEYWVDAGMISAIPAEALSEGADLQGGHLIDVDHDFEFKYWAGDIFIAGVLKIKTDD